MTQKNITGLDGWIWAFWGNRPYARNTHDMTEFGSYLFMVVFTALTIPAFYFLPLKYFSFLVLVGFNGFLCCLVISKANQSWLIPIGNLIIGSIGLIAHIHFGLSLFHHHFEQYFWLLYASSGVLGTLRRIWNALIWKKLDQIILKHRIYSYD